MRKFFKYLVPRDAIVIIVYVSIFVIFLLFQTSGTAGSLVVHSSGVEYRYDLSQAQVIEFEGPIGRTLIEINEDGHAEFTYSDCRDQICVHSGRLEQGSDWAACLPNRIIAQMNSQVFGNTDAGTF